MSFEEAKQILSMEDDGISLYDHLAAVSKAQEQPTGKETEDELLVLTVGGRETNTTLRRRGTKTGPSWSPLSHTRPISLSPLPPPSPLSTFGAPTASVRPPRRPRYETFQNNNDERERERRRQRQQD